MIVNACTYKQILYSGGTLVSETSVEKQIHINAEQLRESEVTQRATDDPESKEPG